MEKAILVIGNVGTGKKELSQRLASQLDSKSFCFDSIVEGIAELSESDVIARIESYMRKLPSLRSWVAYGASGEIAEKLAAYSDTLVFLDFGYEICEEIVRSEQKKSDSKSIELSKGEKSGQLTMLSEYYESKGRDSYYFHSKFYSDFKTDKDAWKFTSVEQANALVTLMKIAVMTDKGKQ